MTLDLGALLAAAELVDDLDRQTAHVEAAFELGFRLGYGHGYDVGYGQAEREIAEQWATVTKSVAARPETADARVRHAESEARRMARRHEAEFMRRHPNGYRSEQGVA